MLMVMMLSFLCPLLLVSGDEPPEGSGAVGSGDEIGSSDNGSGIVWDSDNPLAVDIQAVSDSAVLAVIDEIRDAVYLCCACVMFSGGAIVGLLTVRGFWYV